MERIVRLLRARKYLLDKCKFFDFQKKSGCSVQERLIFVPSMLFFVMGFRDALRVLKIQEEDQSKLQKLVNKRCDQDSDHQEWYLNDLQLLQERGILGDIEVEPRSVWSDSWWKIRNNVYQILLECKQVEHPFYRMLIIQILEATFESFRDGIKETVKQTGLYQQLEYFGIKHAEAEEFLQSKFWLRSNEQQLTAEYNYISDDIISEGVKIINELFDTFEEMFDVWHQICSQHNLQNIKVRKESLPETRFYFFRI